MLWKYDFLYLKYSSQDRFLPESISGWGWSVLSWHLGTQKVALSSQYVFLSSARGAPKGWQGKFEIGLTRSISSDDQGSSSVKAAFESPFHLVTRFYSPSCWNLGCLQKLSSLPGNVKGLDWPVLLLQLIELSTLLSLGHHQSSDNNKGLEGNIGSEASQRPHCLKKEAACGTKYSPSNVWIRGVGVNMK